MVALGAMDYVAVAAPAFAHSGRDLNGQTHYNPHNFRSVPFIAFKRKDDMQAEFVGQAFGLTHVTLNQLFVPSSEGQVRAVLAGWGVSVLPRLLAEGLLQQGLLLNVAPACAAQVQLNWHC